MMIPDPNDGQRADGDTPPVPTELDAEALDAAVRRLLAHWGPHGEVYAGATNDLAALRLYHFNEA